MKKYILMISLGFAVSWANAQERKAVNAPAQDTVYFNKDGKIISQDSVKKNTPQEGRNPDGQKPPKQNKSNAERQTEQAPLQNKSSNEIKKANSREPHEMRRDTIRKGSPK